MPHNWNKIDEMLVYVFILIAVMAEVSGNIIYTERKLNKIDKNETDYHVEYVLIDNNNPCRRNCEIGSPPMICRYQFKIESYHTLSKACYDCPFNIPDCFRQDCVPGEGSKRGIVTINRQIPGPPIEVCQNDTIIVDLHNDMISESTTIHWHGQHQIETPYMDGVPSVTQCPILPRDTFRYTFKAVQAGTHFYHSHIGMQRADGAYGPLIVRVPEENDPNTLLYDFDLNEHTMTIIDWTIEIGTEVFLSHHHNDGDNKPPTILINGLGRFTEFRRNGTNESVYMPAARFNVEQGYRYRFRVINAGFLNCPVEMSIDNHTLTVISTDGSDIKPIEVTSLVSYAGERFDFVLNADQPKNHYWIRYKGLMDCDERFTKAYQVAVLRYEGVSLDGYPAEGINYENAHNDGLQLNPLNAGTESTKLVVTMPHLKTQLPWDDSLKEVPDYQFYIAFDFYQLQNTIFHIPNLYGYNQVKNEKQQVMTPQFNHISFQFPPFPLLSQRDQIPDDMFCNNDTIKNQNCKDQHCTCPHGIHVPLGAVVEIVFIDEGFAYDANHPIHLHGYGFRIVAMERMGLNVTVDEVKQRDAKGLIKRNLKDAPLKDTVTVPDGGYTVVRFKANNPGYWILHCHLEFHAEIGMAMIVQVGDKDEMKPVPPDFPRCGQYMPDFPIRTDDTNDIPISNKLDSSSSKVIFGNDVALFILILHGIYFVFRVISESF